MRRLKLGRQRYIKNLRMRCTSPLDNISLSSFFGFVVVTPICFLLFLVNQKLGIYKVLG